VISHLLSPKGRQRTAVAGIAHGYGMRLLGFDAHPNPACHDFGLGRVEPVIA
jgi:hypothetical protein